MIFTLIILAQWVIMCTWIKTEMQKEIIASFLCVRLTHGDKKMGSSHSQMIMKLEHVGVRKNNNIIKFVKLSKIRRSDKEFNLYF